MVQKPRSQDDVSPFAYLIAKRRRAHVASPDRNVWKTQALDMAPRTLGKNLGALDRNYALEHGGKNVKRGSIARPCIDRHIARRQQPRKPRQRRVVSVPRRCGRLLGRRKVVSPKLIALSYDFGDPPEATVSLAKRAATAEGVDHNRIGHDTFRQARERPRSLSTHERKTRGPEGSQVTRDIRLTLAEKRRKLAHPELFFRYKRKNAQSDGLTEHSVELPAGLVSCAVHKPSIHQYG